MPQPANRQDTELSPSSVLDLELDRLDNNPFQPRSTLDEDKLSELAASIAQSGLLQPIAVRLSGNGRYEIVAGHRRVAAYRKLKVEASTDAAKRAYLRIRAQVIKAVDNNQMAIAAYVENAQRHDLNAVEEANALSRIKDLGHLATAKEVAAVTGQNEQRVRRLLRLAAAPPMIKDAVTAGMLVENSPGRRERRRLDLVGALEFVRLFDFHLQTRPSPKHAQERTEKAVRLALEEGWGTRRILQHVERALAGKQQEATGATGSDVQTDPGLSFRFDEARIVSHDREALLVVKRQLERAIQCVDGRLAGGASKPTINAG